MLQPLRDLHTLFLKHGDTASARIVSELLELHATDGDRFWDFLTSNSVWGGAGSLADQFLLESILPESDLASDRRLAWRALIEIAQEMESSKRVNERTSMWASAFQQWLRDGV
jgi:hypothetical protein